MNWKGINNFYPVSASVAVEARALFCVFFLSFFFNASDIACRICLSDPVGFFLFLFLNNNIKEYK